MLPKTRRVYSPRILKMPTIPHIKPTQRHATVPLLVPLHPVTFARGKCSIISRSQFEMWGAKVKNAIPSPTRHAPITMENKPCFLPGVGRLTA